jgi:hypothetical protein
LLVVWDLEACRNCVDEIEAEILVVLRPRKKTPYVPLVLGTCVVVFYKIGEHDQEIGTTVGLIVGALVLAANVFYRDWVCTSSPDWPS